MPAAAQTTGSVSKSSQTQTVETYKSEEIMAQGRQFFGKASRDLAGAVEYAFKNQGEPTAYIVGEEAAGAFVGGLRYGNGTIYYKDGTKKKIHLVIFRPLLAACCESCLVSSSCPQSGTPACKFCQGLKCKRVTPPCP